ncbi:MAG: alpha/beta fold hydrolase [Solirubrobacterales bacterium]
MTRSTRPRLLLVPEFTEVEWDQIRPLLEEWAEVASYDPPGVGGEPESDTFDRSAIVRRGLEEVDRRRWEQFFVASDSWGIASAVPLAAARPEAIDGLALGHAKLSFRRDGPRAPLNAGVHEAMTELVKTDHEQFLRYGAVQATGGSINEEQAERMIKRFPRELMQRGWAMITRDDADLGEPLAKLDCPLLFAKHEGCLGSTEEGFEDAATAFPQATTISVRAAPLASPAFAEALRQFCLAAKS